MIKTKTKTKAKKAEICKAIIGDRSRLKEKDG